MRLNRLQRRATKTNDRRPLWRPRLERLEDKLAPTVFTVINTSDSGPGSLRQALLDAENTPNVGGPDRVEFNIPGGGVHTIFPASTLGFADGLPQIIDPVIIDGYTQPGASPNTLAVGDDAVLKIEINGSNLPGTNLFNLDGENSTVRGLAITQFPGSAFVLGNFGSLVGSGNHTTIAGNFIGTDAGGLTVQAQGDSRAIGIISGSNNVFGGPAPADRNVITSPREMFFFQTGTGNVIQGNYIGVNKDGTGPLQPPSGTFAVVIRAESGSNTIAGNVILGTDTGILLAEGTTGHNLVQGNFIGTNATGTAALGGTQGIADQGSSDSIIGNVISGVSTGISINHQGPPGPGPTIQGNKIGTDVTGTLAIPNSGHGIFILSSPGGAAIGGTNPGEGNTIANNGGFGIFINVGTSCSILGNSIFANGNLGINLNGSLDGFTGPVTPNDPGDGDGDANGLQNFPVLTSASAGSSTTVVGTLNSTPNTTFRIEFFASDAADPTGFGEGQTFLDFTTVTTDGNGDASFTVTLQSAVALGQVVTATATDPAGNTSEYSQSVAATSQDVIIDANTTEAFLDSLTVIHGSLIMVGVAGRTDLILPNLTRVDGDVIITGNPDLTTLGLPLLATVGGDVDISDNPALTSINLGSVTTVGGSLSVSGDTAATGVDLSTLTSVGGTLSVNGNTAATGVDLASLSTVGGGVSVSGDTAATGVDLASLSSVGGTLSVNGNTAATGVDLASLSTVGGGVSVSGNTAATGVDLASLSSVGGDETLETQNSITSVTADGSTQVTLLTADARLTAALAAGTFANAVPFTVIRLDPAALPPEPGLNATGGAATIDPLAAYRFQFGIPTLGQNASLSFEINVAALSPAERAAFLASLAAGTATVAVKNDAPGSVFQAFALAAPGQPPSATSVTLTRLDANHNPLPAGSNATPAFVRFEGVTGHFSTFAVVTVTGQSTTPSNPLVVVSADGGGSPHVKVFDALTGTLLGNFLAFDQHFGGGVRVAVGDVNGDGHPDVIVAAGQGGGPHVKVIDGTKTGQVDANGQIADSALLASFFAYDVSFGGGVFVAAGDVNGDGKADVITGAGQSGGPHVKVFDGATGQVLASYFAYDASFHGGVRVAAGDVNGDGHADIVTGAGQGGGPHVKVFDGANVAHVLRSFFAFDATHGGGVYVAAGDIDGDHKADLVVSQGNSGPVAHARKYDGATGNLLADFVPFPNGQPAHDVRVALTDRDGDGLADLVASLGNGRPPLVRTFKGTTLALLDEFAAFDLSFRGGVFVG
jgi:trimeric autotransporter adhesin